MTSPLPAPVQAFSGALGAATANALVYPLDLIATRVQAGVGIFDLSEEDAESAKGNGGENEIGRKDNMETWRRKLRTIASMYRGIDLDTIATIVSNFVYFFAYTSLRQHFIPPSPSKGAPSSTLSRSISTSPAALDILIGYLAGLSSRAVSTPLNVLTVRKQTSFSSRSHSSSLLHRFLSLYSSFPPTLLLAFQPSISLYVYQLFRRLFLRGRDREVPKPWQAFIGGAVGSAMSVTLLYPLILAKTLLQSGAYSSSSSSSPQKPLNDKTSKDPSSNEQSRIPLLPILHTHLQHTRTISSLYRGLWAHLLKGVLSQGVGLMVKARIEQLIVRAYLRYLRRSRVGRASA